MIIDMHDTSTRAIAKKLVSVRDESGVSTIGRVLTLIVLADEVRGSEDAIEAANEASREHPCRVIVVIRGNRAQSNCLDGQIRLGGDAGEVRRLGEHIGHPEALQHRHQGGVPGDVEGRHGEVDLLRGVLEPVEQVHDLVGGRGLLGRVGRADGLTPRRGGRGGIGALGGGLDTRDHLLQRLQHDDEPGTTRVDDPRARQRLELGGGVGESDACLFHGRGDHVGERGASLGHDAGRLRRPPHDGEDGALDGLGDGAPRTHVGLVQDRRQQVPDVRVVFDHHRGTVLAG